MGMIPTRKISEDGIEELENLTLEELEQLYKYGDYIHYREIAFRMVHYSIESLPSGQSINVSYWSPLYDIQLDLNYANKTIEVIKPVIDWAKSGF